MVMATICPLHGIDSYNCTPDCNPVIGDVPAPGDDAAPASAEPAISAPAERDRWREAHEREHDSMASAVVALADRVDSLARTGDVDAYARGDVEVIVCRVPADKAQEVAEYAAKAGARVHRV